MGRTGRGMRPVGYGRGRDCVGRERWGMGRVEAGWVGTGVVGMGWAGTGVEGMEWVGTGVVGMGWAGTGVVGRAGIGRERGAVTRGTSAGRENGR